MAAAVLRELRGRYRNRLMFALERTLEGMVLSSTEDDLSVSDRIALARDVK